MRLPDRDADKGPREIDVRLLTTLPGGEFPKIPRVRNDVSPPRSRSKGQRRREICIQPRPPAHNVSSFAPPLQGKRRNSRPFIGPGAAIVSRRPASCAAGSAVNQQAPFVTGAEKADADVMVAIDSSHGRVPRAEIWPLPAAAHVAAEITRRIAAGMRPRRAASRRPAASMPSHFDVDRIEPADERSQSARCPPRPASSPTGTLRSALPSARP